MRKVVFLAVLLSSFSLSAKADPAPIPMSPELQAFLMRADQQQAVKGLMAQQWRSIFENCPAPQMQGMNVLIANPPNFNSAGVPTSGQWRMVGRLEGCGEKRILNVEYVFAQDGQMKRVALLPGTTIADLRLQRDALIYAAMGMAPIAPKSCKDIKYIDTNFTGFDGEALPDAPGRRPWSEEWTVRSCGVTGVVTIHFIPDATGTAITSEMNETRRIEP